MIKMIMFVAITIAAFAQIVAADPKVITAGVVKDSSGAFRVVEGPLEPHKYIASAKYTVGLETIGWDLLAITTNFAYSDEDQASAAGYLEGSLTKDRIWNHWLNLNEKTYGKNSKMPDLQKTFFKKQAEYVEKMFNENPDDEIWNAGYLMQKQFNALVKGYNDNVSTQRNIDIGNFHTISSFGELFDIQHWKNPSNNPNFDKMSLEELKIHFHSNSHCSAIFKATDNFSDVYFGHNSWFYYSALTRIFKEYNFNFNRLSVKSRNVIFSSYPGLIASADDFYVTSQDLTVIETTNVYYDTELYKKITPKSLLTWQRAMIANRLATDGESWTRIFGTYNSGTYNNQFMVLDMKKVHPEKNHIEDGALFIIEQIPGQTDTNDVTNHLRYGYWPSYNSPYSLFIKSASKIDEQIAKNPGMKDVLDYDTCTRANIFRRDQAKANSYEAFQHLIRHNDYKNDPLSFGDPSNAISSRIDLKIHDDAKHNNCRGAYDAKMSSVTRAKGKYKTISIIVGPTAERQPVFKWKESPVCKNEPKNGLPDEYKFDWYEYKNVFVDDYDRLESETLEMME